MAAVVAQFGAALASATPLAAAPTAAASTPGWAVVVVNDLATSNSVSMTTTASSATTNLPTLPTGNWF